MKSVFSMYRRNALPEPAQLPQVDAVEHRGWIEGWWQGIPVGIVVGVAAGLVLARFV